ncbi:MAG: hypothetical protein R2755_19955 [Acidimicrobiales bacterium]
MRLLHRLGNARDGASFQNSPSWTDSASTHNRRMSSMYSSLRAPRRSHGTCSASNSSRCQPTPMPKSNRPPESQSTLATSLAV